MHYNAKLCLDSEFTSGKKNIELASGLDMVKICILQKPHREGTMKRL